MTRPADRDYEAEMRHALDRLSDALAGDAEVQRVTEAARWQRATNGFAGLVLMTIVDPPPRSA